MRELRSSSLGIAAGSPPSERPGALEPTYPSRGAAPRVEHEIMGFACRWRPVRRWTSLGGARFGRARIRAVREAGC